MDGGTLSFTLAEPIEETDHLIVIDAAQLNQPPGSVQVFEGRNMDTFVGGNKKTSVHEVSLTDLFTIAQLAEKLPAQRALIGIQPQYIDWSDTLTEPVHAALTQVCDEILGLVEKWQNG
jgi:hydrogenase maturation protease